MAYVLERFAVHIGASRDEHMHFSYIGLGGSTMPDAGEVKCVCLFWRKIVGYLTLL